MIWEDPNIDLDVRIKKLRQVIFKQEYKARQQGRRGGLFDVLAGH